MQWWNIENRMIVEGERYWNDIYTRKDEEDVRYCDICDCEDCPRYGDDCDGEDYEDLNDREFDIPYEEV